jgi:hypothetical protein
MDALVGRNTSLRNAWYASLGLLLLMLLGSIIWYKQRMLFGDPAYLSFRIINEKQLFIPEHRYGAVVTQAWPLIGGMLHLPLRVVLILYSASFYLFYCFVILMLGRWRQYALGILFALYLSLFVSDVYFWPNNEVHQGIGWLMLFLGLFFRYQEAPRIPFWTHIVMLGCLFLALFSHFIVVVPCTFLWIYWLLYNPRYWAARSQRIRLAAYSLAIALIFLCKLKLGVNGWYDGEKLGAALNVHPHEIFESFYSGQAHTMGRLILRNYWLVIPIFLIGLAALLRLKQWGKLALTLCYAAGFFSLVCLTYSNAFGRHQLFYMESEWMAWGILLATPFVVQVLPLWQPRLAFAAVSVIFVVRLMYIGQAFRLFDAHYHRLDTIIEALRRRGITKAIVIADKPARDAAFLMDWSVAYESMQLSALKGYQPPVTFMAAGADYEAPPANTRLFVSPSLNLEAQQFNAEYYSIDTTQAYLRLPLKEL